MGEELGGTSGLALAKLPLPYVPGSLPSPSPPQNLRRPQNQILIQRQKFFMACKYVKYALEPSSSKDPMVLLDSMV